MGLSLSSHLILPLSPASSLPLSLFSLFDMVVFVARQGVVTFSHSLIVNKLQSPLSPPPALNTLAAAEPCTTSPPNRQGS